MSEPISRREALGGTGILALIAERVMAFFEDREFRSHWEDIGEWQQQRADDLEEDLRLCRAGSE